MNEKKIIKQLNEGSFYMTHDGSETGHPGMIYWKSDEKNLYLAFKTDTSDGPHRTKLTVKTDDIVDESFVMNRPFLGKRKDFGSKELTDMHFSLEDYDILITISQKKPICSSSINRKDRRKLPKDTTFNGKRG